METLTPHPLEPEAAAAPPRRLLLAPATSALTVLAMLLFLLFLAGGARALWEAGKLGWIAATGQNIPARIVAADTSPPDTPGSPSRQQSVRYAFPAPGQPTAAPITGTIRLGPLPEAENIPLAAVGSPPASRLPSGAFHIGDTLILRRARWLGRPILIPWPAHPGAKIAFLAFCGALIAAVSFAFMRRLARWAGHRIHLLQRGIATVGTITHKHSRAEDAPQYFIRYGYGDRQSPPLSYETEEQVTHDQWQSLHIGQPVTVLYDPHSPAVSGLFALLRG